MLALVPECLIKTHGKVSWFPQITQAFFHLSQANSESEEQLLQGTGSIKGRKWKWRLEMVRNREQGTQKQDNLKPELTESPTHL